MLSDDQFQALITSPGFDSVGVDYEDRLRESASRLEVPADTEVFGEGDRCEAFLVIISGTVRVSKLAEDGRELLLYTVSPGEYCVQTVGCLIGNVPYSARGVTVDAVSVVAVPRDLFEELVGNVPAFRQVIFDLISDRLSVLMRLVQEVAFYRLDRRLASLLVERAKSAEDAVVATTHQKLAEDLGTSREIVSRILESFEAQKLVKLGRGRIHLVDPEGIRHRYIDGM